MACGQLVLLWVVAVETKPDKRTSMDSTNQKYCNLAGKQGTAGCTTGCACWCMGTNRETTCTATSHKAYSLYRFQQPGLGTRESDKHLHRFKKEHHAHAPRADAPKASNAQNAGATWAFLEDHGAAYLVLTHTTLNMMAVLPSPGSLLSSADRRATVTADVVQTLNGMAVELSHTQPAESDALVLSEPRQPCRTTYVAA